MAITNAELEQQLKAALDRIEALEVNAATKADLSDAVPFVAYVTTKYVGDGQSKEWQIRPALPLPGGILIVFAPDDEGGTFTVRDAPKSNKAHIPGTWHDSEG